MIKKPGTEQSNTKIITKQTNKNVPNFSKAGPKSAPSIPMRRAPSKNR